MRILELKELSAELLAQIPSLPALDGDPPMGIGQIRAARRSGLPYSDYYAVYAVEDGRLIGRVETSWFPFTGPLGRQTVVGICDVLVRPTDGRKGGATALLAEVHRREAALGREWSFLWTHRTWGAHRLYERLGYADVYSPPLAIRAVPRRDGPRRPAPESWSTARRTEAPVLEGVLAEGTRGRMGFVPRSPGSFSARFRLGWRSPRNHRLLRSGSRVVGYAHVVPVPPRSTIVTEVVLTSADHAEPMLDALEAEAAGRWLMFETTTFVTDQAPLLTRRGYEIHLSTHRVMMAKRLVEAPAGLIDPAAVGRDPAFSNHRGDMF